jgi:hypothetical protein
MNNDLQKAQELIREALTLVAGRIAKTDHVGTGHMASLTNAANLLNSAAENLRFASRVDSDAEPANAATAA